MKFVSKRDLSHTDLTLPGPKPRKKHNFANLLKGKANTLCKYIYINNYILLNYRPKEFN